MRETKIVLPDREIPKQWYNIAADMPNPMKPPLHPGTKQPAGPADLSPIFPMALIEQEVSTERWIDIPEEVLDIYTLWRPSPMYRAHRLEAALGTPAKIYYKNEGVSPGGSHKPTTSVAQAYYNREAGIKRIATETGAGQWGSALAMAGSLFGLDITVYMVKVSYNQKPYRRIAMETWDATVHPSPSPLTNAGRKILEQDPESHPRGHQLFPGLRAEPRAPAPDGHRPGGQEAVRDGGRLPRRHHRLLRRREQPRGGEFPLPSG
jgi:tryptophan synthase beta chain